MHQQRLLAKAIAIISTVIINKSDEICSGSRFDVKCNFIHKHIVDVSTVIPNLIYCQVLCVLLIALRDCRPCVSNWPIRETKQTEQIMDIPNGAINTYTDIVLSTDQVIANWFLILWVTWIWSIQEQCSILFFDFFFNPIHFSFFQTLYSNTPWNFL